MRARFLFAAGITDALREVFGAGVVPTYMQQGEDEWGRKVDESKYRVIKGKDMVFNIKRYKKGAA